MRIYQPGKRNFNWIKLKRQEEGHLEDTIDCVILGYYAGEGKRAILVSAHFWWESTIKKKIALKRLQKLELASKMKIGKI